MQEIQRLNGQVIALNRFVSYATVKALKKMRDVKWTNKCEMAFQQLTSPLRMTLLLSKPVKREELYIYLIVSLYIVSSIIV